MTGIHRWRISRGHTMAVWRSSAIRYSFSHSFGIAIGPNRFSCVEQIIKHELFANIFCFLCIPCHPAIILSNYQFYVGWLCASGLGGRPTVLVVDAEFRLDHHVRHLDARRPASLFRYHTRPNYRNGCAWCDGITSAIVRWCRHHRNGVVVWKIQDGRRWRHRARRYQCRYINKFWRRKSNIESAANRISI